VSRDDSSVREAVERSKMDKKTAWGGKKGPKKMKKGYRARRKFHRREMPLGGGEGGETTVATLEEEIPASNFVRKQNRAGK